MTARLMASFPNSAFCASGAKPLRERIDNTTIGSSTVVTACTAGREERTERSLSNAGGHGKEVPVRSISEAIDAYGNAGNMGADAVVVIAASVSSSSISSHTRTRW